MRDTRTIHGQGILVCGDAHAAAVYRIDLFSDGLGNKKATGSLQIDTEFAFKAALAVTCRLILKNGTEMAVHVTPTNGNAHIQSSGQIPNI